MMTDLPPTRPNTRDTSASDDRAERRVEDGTTAPDAANPFPRHIPTADPSYLVDDILPSGTLLESVAVDVLNSYINAVDLRSVITERDPEEEERHISISNRFYTHFHEFGTVIHVVASSARHFWYFCYDIDASDCAIGRVAADACSLPDVVQWVYRERVSRRFPTVEIDIRNLQGWRSFQ